MISADTNVFVYTVDHREPEKRDVAVAVVAALEGAEAIVGLQVVGEMQNVLRRRLRLPSSIAYQAARDLRSRFPAFAYDDRAVDIALSEAAAGRLSYWDALLLAAAGLAGVTAMLSEDMRDGLVLGGVEVINPFGPTGMTARAQGLLNP